MKAFWLPVSGILKTNKDNPCEYKTYYEPSMKQKNYTHRNFSLQFTSQDQNLRARFKVGGSAGSLCFLASGPLRMDKTRKLCSVEDHPGKEGFCFISMLKASVDQMCQYHFTA